MVISIWRYSHLTLAISSFVFILIASLTGIVLAFEPISDKVQAHSVDVKKISLAETVDVLQKKYHEVLTIERDHNNAIIASVILEDGSDAKFYIDPTTGEKIGDLKPKAGIYKFATNLHRSLFLKSTGRAIIGIVSFLLFLIAITGILLIVKRQGGVQKFFAKVIKEDNKQFYHVVLGRYSLIPIVILTLTGVYLSLEKFSLLPESEVSHQIEEINSEYSKISPRDFEVFQSIQLSDIKSLEFPFSEFDDDYFYLKTKRNEQVIHQYSGEVLSTIKHPFVQMASTLSFNLHTGRGSILWSLILLISTASILYFIYSGFAMTLERKKKNKLIPKNSISKEEAEFVILVGSETGNTYRPAKLLFDALNKVKKKTFITELNDFSGFTNLKNLIVMTSTYGEGEAPTNANQFLKNLPNYNLSKEILFSVVGFGSLAYKDFCGFAKDIQKTLSEKSGFTSITDLYSIHNQDWNEFAKWKNHWSQKTNIPLTIEPPKSTIEEKLTSFEVIERTELNLDNTYLLQLRPKKKINFQSGDLLNFYPEGESVARQYSMGLKGKDILLSIKKHEFGLASSQLSKIKTGETIRASIQPNKEFHYNPKKTTILIANGTGIVPFIGMIQENKNKKDVHLFWGGRTRESFTLYDSTIGNAIETKRLSNLTIAYSQEEEKQYVQDVLLDEFELINKVLSNKGQILICGSLAMEKEVRKVIDKAVNFKIQKYQEQILSDCY